MPIIVSRDGRNAKKVDSSSFEKEDYLQRYIYENPDSIPLYEIKEDIRLLVLAREFPTNSGPIDAIGIDRDGEMYVIETKFYKNSDKRLVVAQLLDYGASLWRHYSDFTEFTRLLEAAVNKKSNTTMNQRMKDFFGLNDDEVAVLLANMRKHLNEGSFKFVVLMDKLDSRLKDLVTFINQNSQFSIYAVEIEYYKYEGYEILIPKLYGAEVRKEVGISSGQRRRWDEQSFFEDARARVKDGVRMEAIKRVYEFSKSATNEIAWGTGASSGSFSPKFTKISARSPYSVFSDGRLQLNFGWMDDTEAAKNFKEVYRRRVREIEGFPDYADSEWPQLPIEVWSLVVEEFLGAIRGLLDQAVPGSA